ncbi:MAG: hypothetical protein ABI790_02470 [Betaproteobacteria bacterium]
MKQRAPLAQGYVEREALKSYYTGVGRHGAARLYWVASAMAVAYRLEGTHRRSRALPPDARLIGAYAPPLDPAKFLADLRAVRA